MGQQSPERRTRRPPAQGSLLLVLVSRCADLSTNPRPQGGPCLETLALPCALPPAQHAAQDAGSVTFDRPATFCHWHRTPPVIGTLKMPGPQWRSAGRDADYEPLDSGVYGWTSLSVQHSLIS